MYAFNPPCINPHICILLQSHPKQLDSSNNSPRQHVKDRYSEAILYNKYNNVTQ